MMIPREHEAEGDRSGDELYERSRDVRHRAAEETGRPGTEDGAAGDGVALAPPVLAPTRSGASIALSGSGPQAR